MLQNLHVKNLALIDEIEVDFSKGLNILTGETGAGKSIILGSINLALGGKYSADILHDKSHLPKENLYLCLHYTNCGFSCQSAQHPAAGLRKARKYPEIQLDFRVLPYIAFSTVFFSGILGMPPGISVDRLAAVEA